MKPTNTTLKAVAPLVKDSYITAILADGLNYFCGFMQLQNGIKATEWDLDGQYKKMMTADKAKSIAGYLKKLQNIENVKVEKL